MYDSYSSEFVDKILKYDHSNPNGVEPSRFVESVRQNRNASGILK